MAWVAPVFISGPHRVKATQDHGARGVLTFRSDGQPTGGFFRGGLTKSIYKPDFAVVSIESKVVDFIFKWQRADPRFFFQQIELTGKPQSYDLGVQSLLNLKVSFDERRMTENVLARLPGSDETLKNEYVIVGAHMDHLGIDMAGDVLNGADDNASGTAVVMEAARVMKLNGFAPKRTIIFALWGAEEEGLLGSKYYTEHPIYPIEKTVANINLDMEGHGTGKVGASGAYYAPETWQILKGGLPKEILENASGYFTRLDAAKQAVGAEYLAIVASNSLWQAAGKEQMVALMAAMLKAGYSLEDMANLTSGSFMRALNRARTADPIRP